MIPYHGLPITPNKVAVEFLKGRHGFVSFFNPGQVRIAVEQCQSYGLDNGAFSAWKKGKPVTDWRPYAEWVAKWSRPGGCDFAIMPDVIGGSEAENDDLIEWWKSQHVNVEGVPVWHLHESLDRLRRLSVMYRRVALGSSGEYAKLRTKAWKQRMADAMDAICDEHGHPPCKLHGLRMLDPTIFSQFPFASADSTNVARNIGIDKKWDASPYAPKSKSVRALVIAGNVEHHASALRWRRGRVGHYNAELFG